MGIQHIGLWAAIVQKSRNLDRMLNGDCFSWVYREV